MPADPPGGLVGVVAKALELLRGEPVLVAAVAGGALVAFLAVYAPEGRELHAWLLVALVIALAGLWAVVTVIRARRDTNRFRAGAGAKADRIELGEGANIVKLGPRAELGELRLGMPPISGDHDETGPPGGAATSNPVVPGRRRGRGASRRRPR